MQRAERPVFQAGPSRCESGHGRQIIPCSRSPMQRHCVENAASAGASPAASTTSHRAGSIKVMQRTFNPWNRAHYPGGSPAFPTESWFGEPIIASWCNRSIPGFDPDGPGATPGEAANWQVELRPPGGEIASRLAYTQKSRGQNLPGRPLPHGVRAACWSLKPAVQVRILVRQPFRPFNKEQTP